MRGDRIASVFEPGAAAAHRTRAAVLDADCDIQLGFDQGRECRAWLRSEISVRLAPAPQAARNTARGLRCPTRMTGRSSTAQCVAFGDFSLGMAWARQGGSRARRHKHRRCEIFVVCERRSMPSSRGAKKAAQRRPTLKPASLTSKRSSNGLLHSRRGGEGCHPAIEPTKIRWQRPHLEDEDCHLEDKAALT